MKVYELIEQLQKVNPNLDVVITVIADRVLVYDDPEIDFSEEALKKYCSIDVLHLFDED